MAQEETFTCSTCHEIKAIQFKYSCAGKICKACNLKSVRNLQARYRIANTSINWSRPTVSRCSRCKETLPGIYFSLNRTTFNGLKHVCKYHATLENLKERNLQMLLTKEQFHKLLDAPCYYCGSIENVGVDRAFNNEDYTVENCVSCCWTCNKMKNNSDADRFLNVVEKIFNYRVKNLIELCDQLESEPSV